MLDYLKIFSEKVNDMNKRIRVAVLYGGRSTEHEVSLQSAANVMAALDKNQYEVIPIGIDKSGNWFLGDEVFKRSVTHDQVQELLSSESAWFQPDWIQGSNLPIHLPAKNAMQTASQNGKCFDVIFPAVHGSLCEDGSLQGLLEQIDVPYVGCGVLASAISMDKDVAKRLVKAAGVSVAPYFIVRAGEFYQHPEKIVAKAMEHIHLPLFVKPANTGSSVGISKVKTVGELIPAIQEAFRFDEKIILEKSIDAIELELAVLESLELGEKPMVSVVGEIKPNAHHEFYSYEAKYQDPNGAEAMIPANISLELSHQAQAMALDIFQALECQGMARIDLFLDRQSGQLYFNEINTIPGFTKISMYPKLMQASGKSYSDLLSHLIQLALNRSERAKKLEHHHLDLKNKNSEKVA